MAISEIQIEVVYATPAGQCLLAICVPGGTTLESAIDRSGITEIFPEIDLSLQKVGIFGKIVSPDAVVKAGDRIEIYRSLQVDPKQARKNRARSQLRKNL